MGAGEARKGNYVLGLDGLYAKLGASKVLAIRGETGALDLTQRITMLDPMGGYTIGDGTWTADLLLGMRYWNLSSSLDVDRTRRPSNKRSRTEQWVDATGGVRLNWQPVEKFRRRRRWRWWRWRFARYLASIRYAELRRLVAMVARCGLPRAGGELRSERFPLRHPFQGHGRGGLVPNVVARLDGGRVSARPRPGEIEQCRTDSLQPIGGTYAWRITEAHDQRTRERGSARWLAMESRGGDRADGPRVHHSVLTCCMRRWRGGRCSIPPSSSRPGWAACRAGWPPRRSRAPSCRCSSWRAGARRSPRPRI